MKRIPATFTAAVLRHLLADPSMPETVRHWRQTEADPRQRVQFFAIQLAEGFLETFRFDEDGGWNVEGNLGNAVMYLAQAHVNWERIAEVLLRRFTLPVMLATAPPGPAWELEPRLRPAIWNGPLMN